VDGNQWLHHLSDCTFDIAYEISQRLTEKSSVDAVKQWKHGNALARQEY